MLLQTTAISTGAAYLTSPFQATRCHSHCCCNSDKNLTQNSPFSLPKTVFLPRLGKWFHVGNRSRSSCHIGHFRAITPCATMLETPVLWAGRLCIFYALLKAGLAGSPTNPLFSDLESGADDFGFYDWFQALSKPAATISKLGCILIFFSSVFVLTEFGFSNFPIRLVAFGNCIHNLVFSESVMLKFTASEKEAAERRKFVSKWHPTTKGTLRRNYRIPSKSEGRRLLKAIASLLSDDDQFRDATSHKGCQIRRENAHGESVCCNNVRALFDELPTPHLVVEITAFPAGPLTENDYAKAERLERVLRSGPSV